MGGAGHNALGAWLWLAGNGHTGTAASIVMRQRIGTEVLPVEIVRTPGEPVRIVMDQGRPEFAALLADAGAEGCYVYTTAGYTRFFNPTVGIAEDPATGTAAGPLAALLVRSGHASPVFLEQGRHLGRPSRIRVDVDGDRVRLSDSGVLTGSGELRLR